MSQMSSEMKKIAKERKRRLAAEKGSTIKSPALALAQSNLSLSTEHENDENVEMSGLTDTRFCTTPENLATVLGSMVGDTLKYLSDEKRDLVQQFGVYFSALGLKTEDYMTVTAGKSIPMFYLAKSTTFDELHNYHGSNLSSHQRILTPLL